MLPFEMVLLVIGQAFSPMVAVIVPRSSGFDMPVVENSFTVISVVPPPDGDEVLGEMDWMPEVSVMESEVTV